MISPRYVTIDGYPVSVGNLETSSRANLGYDQLRGLTDHGAISKLPWTATLGSTVTVTDATAQVVWQGRLSAPLRVEADQTVRLAAQGHAYSGAKSGRRLPVKVVSVKGWTVGNTAPLDIPQTASAQPTIEYGEAPGKLASNQFLLSLTSATDASVAFYAPGAEIRRLTWNSASVPGGPTIGIYGAKGPDANASKVLISTLSSMTSGGSVTLPANDYDVIIIRLTYGAGTSGTFSVTGPVVWGSTVASGSLMSHDIARAIGEMMDWDASAVSDVGTCEFTSFDWAADVAGGMTEATIPDDFRWLLLDDRGSGPFIDFGPWERTWEVSGAEGAIWSLDPLEKFTKVVVQYINDIGKAYSVEAEIDDPELYRVTNELRTTAGGLQSVDSPGTLPEQMAANILELASSERWRGTISTSQVREASTGLTDIYRVRGGDLVRITDFSPTDGAVTLRISEVTQTGEGITLGIEAPTFAAGGLTPTAGGPTQGTFFQIDPNTYAPPGSAGSTIPIGDGGIITDPQPSGKPGSGFKLPPRK